MTQKEEGVCLGVVPFSSSKGEIPSPNPDLEAQPR